MTPANLRNGAIRLARGFFAKRNILEVMTAKAVASPALEPYIDALQIRAAHTPKPLYLATSPEFALKKLFASEIAANPAAQGIYEIANVFRDDPPGKNHALEFTMIEWYLKDSSLRLILEMTGELISAVASGLQLPPIAPGVEILDLPECFARVGCVLDFTDEESVIQRYQSAHGTLPHHLDRMDAAIACFNLLFDEYVMPTLREKPHLVAVSGYPDYLGALAYAPTGVAERAEIFYRGIELANGYREEFRPDVARVRWQKYNTIRRLRAVDEHALDEELLRRLPGIEGTCGIAVGLERVLMGLNPRIEIADFS